MNERPGPCCRWVFAAQSIEGLRVADLVGFDARCRILERGFCLRGYGHGNQGADAAQQAFMKGLRTSFVDAAQESEDGSRASLIANSIETGENLLAVFRRQFARCSSFDFCVAFIAESGLSCLVQILAEAKRAGIKGRILTSTYLNFNSPASFRKLMEYDNIDVHVYQGNLHAKGYLFRDSDTSTVIIGSSNLTQMALTCNKEWNVPVSLL